MLIIGFEYSSQSNISYLLCKLFNDWGNFLKRIFMVDNTDCKVTFSIHYYSLSTMIIFNVCDSVPVPLSPNYVLLLPSYDLGISLLY